MFSDSYRNYWLLYGVQGVRSSNLRAPTISKPIISVYYAKSRFHQKSAFLRFVTKSCPTGFGRCVSLLNIYLIHRLACMFACVVTIPPCLLLHQLISVSERINSLKLWHNQNINKSTDGKRKPCQK